jgi:hypothetical protein
MKEEETANSELFSPTSQSKLGCGRCDKGIERLRLRTSQTLVRSSFSTRNYVTVRQKTNRKGKLSIVTFRDGVLAPQNARRSHAAARLMELPADFQGPPASSTHPTSCGIKRQRLWRSGIKSRWLRLSLGVLLPIQLTPCLHFPSHPVPACLIWKLLTASDFVPYKTAPIPSFPLANLQTLQLHTATPDTPLRLPIDPQILSTTN